MKKAYAIIGTICSVIGFILFLSAQMIIWESTGYTWSKPYTQFEAQTLLVKWIGLLLLICGIIDLVMFTISKYYTNKNVQDVNMQQLTTTTCPNCGLPVNNSAKVCPKCKTELKK